MIDCIGPFKSTLLELFIRNLQIKLQLASWGWEAKLKTAIRFCLQYWYIWVNSSLLRLLQLPGSDLLYSPSKAAGNPVSKVSDQYIQGASLAP